MSAIYNPHLDDQLAAAQLPVAKQFIDGAFVESASGQLLDDLEPATGELLARIPRGDASDVDAAVTAAWKAAPSWGALPASERSMWLYKLADGIEGRFDELAVLESRDTGKPLSLARTMDIPRAIHNFRFFAGAILHEEDRALHLPGALTYTQHKPVGVAALISPWNLPLYLLTWKIAPCLAYGNCAIAKPSELAPLTANALAEIALEIGLPAGVLNILHGLGPEVGQALIDHPRIPAISFTGGTATGRRVAQAAASRFAKTSLELGGKNPNIIFSDADFDSALATTVRSSFANQGEICLCGSRIFVERTSYFPFVEGLVDRAKALVIGDPLADGTQLGALISAAHREKVMSYIALAESEGGRLMCGGGIPTSLPESQANGFYLEPTVIGGLPFDARTQQEEIFGPVVTVTPFDDEREVIDWANSVPYGLSASLWTRDISRAHRMAGQLDAGTVWINTWLQRDLRAPFGGVKASGLGREGGHDSREFFTDAQTVCVKIDL